MMFPAALEVNTRGDREIVVTRAFNAPRELVFDALTTPALLKRWLLGQAGWTFETCEIDLRPGGSYRFVWRAPEGYAMGMRGVYREVVRPERYTGTGKFDQEWFPGEEVSTTTLEEENGRTLFTMTLEYESKEARDVVLKSGMAEGLSHNYDNLEQLLASEGK